MGRQRYIISGSLRVWLWNLALLVGFSGDCFALDPELAQELACLASYEELADDRTFDSDSEWEQQV